MRLGIVSDIHCNIQGLDEALARMGEIDQLWCAGDSVFQFRWSNEVVARLRELGARIAAQRISSLVMQEYSMGMSHDFEVAIEEGATLVRVGTAIFGARNV